MLHGSIHKAILHNLVVKRLEASFIQRITDIYLNSLGQGRIKIYPEAVIFV